MKNELLNTKRKPGLESIITNEDDTAVNNRNGSRESIEVHRLTKSSAGTSLRFRPKSRTDEESENGYIYLTFMTHEGQCIDLGGLYAFLLLQAGVDALSVGSYDNLDHEWTYAIVNGQGYHIDPTWALKTSRYTDSLYLDYFMMSDEIRSETGCPVENLTVQLLPQFFVDRSSLSLLATDDRYYLGEFSTFESLDEENKILRYLDMDGVEHELYYGELSSTLTGSAPNVQNIAPFQAPVSG